MTTIDDIMARAIADTVRGALAAHRPLDAIKMFVRGGVPVGGVSEDKYPFTEIFVASEEYTDEGTGRIKVITYRGVLNIVLHMTDHIVQERQGDRFYYLPSYDEIDRLTHEAIRVLSRQEWADLGELQANYLGQNESVRHFQVPDGIVEYGLDPRDRTSNFEQFAIIPFSVETYRQEALE